MSDKLSIFLEKLSLLGLEYFRVFYGVYRGTVVDNADPESRGRIKVVVPEVGHRQAPDVWVDPAFDFAGGKHGCFFPPEDGDSVRVSFAQGNAGKPNIYWGGWFGAPNDETEVPDDLGYSGGVPVRRGIVTKSGHSLVFSDEGGNEYIKIRWAGKKSNIELKSDGSVGLESESGEKVSLDSSGNKVNAEDSHGNIVTLESGKVTIRSRGSVDIHAVGKIEIKSGNVVLGDILGEEPAVKGRTLKAWLDTHVHPTGVGPSGPPAVPVLPLALSNTVKVK